MKGKTHNKGLSFLLCFVLIVALALTTGGCNGKKQDVSEKGNGKEETTTQADSSVLGEGSKVFDFIVVDQDGTETSFEIHTDQETVGAALLELGLIEGEDSEYGLFVKTVNGITADYDTDGVYWAFYVNGEYASSGVDSTTITEGETYSFRVE